MKLPNNFAFHASVITMLALSAACGSGSEFSGKGKKSGDSQPAAQSASSSNAAPSASTADATSESALANQVATSPAPSAPSAAPSAGTDPISQLLSMLPKLPLPTLPDLTKLLSSLPKLPLPGAPMPLFGATGGPQVIADAIKGVISHIAGGPMMPKLSLPIIVPLPGVDVDATVSVSVTAQSPDQFISAVKAKIDAVIAKLQAAHPEWADDLAKLKAVGDHIQALAVALQGQDEAAVQQAVQGIASSVQDLVTCAIQKVAGDASKAQAAIATIFSVLPQSLGDFASKFANQDVNGIGTIFETIGASVASALAQK